MHINGFVAQALTSSALSRRCVAVVGVPVYVMGAPIIDMSSCDHLCVC